MKRLSVENRILLLLSEHPGWEDKYDAPEVISQKGIARELSMRQNNVSRSLTELSAKGLVGSRSSHIKGLQRKRRIYHLTDEGREVASELKRIVLDRLVLLDDGGSVRELTFRELIDMIRSGEGAASSISSILRDNLDGIDARISTGIGGDLEAPFRDDFFGREAEMDDLRKAFSDPGIVLISVVSIAGQGKTSLIGEFIRRERIGGVIRMEMDDWLYPDNILEILSGKLESRGGSRLSDHLTGSVKVDYLSAVRMLISDLSSTSSVLILEDMHRATPQAVELLQKMLNAARDESPGVKIMTASRWRPPVYSRTDLALDRGVFEMELKGLDRNSVERLIRSRGSGSDVDIIDTLAHGNPLAVILLSSIESHRMEEYSSSLSVFIDDEIIEGLDETERGILKLSSMLNIPAGERLFLGIKGSSHELITDLISRMLLRQNPDGRLDLPDLIRESVSGRLGKEERSDFQDILVDFYMERGGDEDLFQALFYLGRTGRRTDYIDLLLDVGGDLIGRGYHGVTRMAREVDPDPLEINDRIRLLLLLLDGSLAVRDPGAASHYLTQAAKECSRSMRRDGGVESLLWSARILTRQAEIARITNAPDEMKRKYREGLDLFRKIGDHQSEIEIRKRMGNALLELSDIEGAGRYMKSLEGTLMEDGTDEDLAEIHHQLGIIEEGGGRLSDGLRYYLMALAESHRSGREDIENRCNHRIGRLYHMVQDDSEALEFLGRSISGFIRSFDPLSAEEVLIDLIPIGSGSLRRKVKKLMDRSRRSLSESGFRKVFLNRGGDANEIDLALSAADLALSITRKGKGDGIEYGGYLSASAKCLSPDEFLKRIIRIDRILSTYDGPYSPDIFFEGAVQSSGSYGNDRLLCLINMMWGNSVDDPDRSIELYNIASDLAGSSDYSDAAMKVSQLLDDLR